MENLILLLPQEVVQEIAKIMLQQMPESYGILATVPMQHWVDVLIPILLLQLSIVTGSENLAKEDQVMAELIPNTTLQHTDNNNVGGQLNVYLYMSDTMYNNLYVTGGKTNNKIYNYIETGIHRDAMWMQLHTSNGGV